MLNKLSNMGSLIINLWEDTFSSTEKDFLGGEKNQDDEKSEGIRAV